LVLRHRDLAVDTGPLRLELGEGHAVVRFTALLRGGSGGLLPDAARVYQVETGWRLEQGRWWLAGARWTPAVDGARRPSRPAGRAGARLGGGQLPQHVVPRPAVPEVLHLLRGEQQHVDLDAHLAAVDLARDHRGRARVAVLQAGDLVHLGAVQAQGLGVLAVVELQRQHAHADQVGAVDALEAGGDHGLDPEQVGALRRPRSG